MTLTLIGAAFVLGGIALEGAMWFSSRGADAASYRDPAHTRHGSLNPRASDPRYDGELMRSV